MNYPNYKHRTFVITAEKPEDFDDMDLINCVSLSVEQVEGVILQKQSQFENGGRQVNSISNFSTLEIIRKEIIDIKSIVEWYFDKKRGDENE